MIWFPAQLQKLEHFALSGDWCCFLSRVFVMVSFGVKGLGGSSDDASLNSLFAFAYLVLLSNEQGVDGAKQLCA